MLNYTAPMKIHVSPKFPKSTRKIIRAAVRASHAHAPMYGIDHINVVPVPRKRRHEIDGLAEVSGTTAKITVKACPDHTATLDTLFHEAYHIHQMSSGKLILEYGGFRWRGFYIPVWFYETFYRFIAFEREAIKYASKMCNKLEEIL